MPPEWGENRKLNQWGISTAHPSFIHSLGRISQIWLKFLFSSPTRCYLKHHFSSLSVFPPVAVAQHPPGCCSCSSI